MKNISLLLSLCFICGCSEVLSPRARFLADSGQTEADYDTLYETSIETLQANDFSSFRTRTNIVNHVRLVLNDCQFTNNNCTALDDFLSHLQIGANYTYTNDLESVNQLKNI